MKTNTTHQFRLGPICSQDELEELWAIDNAAYGAASITYEKFCDWWRAFPSGLLVLLGAGALVAQSACGLFLTVLRHA